jgi:CheY-like chemotaxis protein
MHSESAPPNIPESSTILLVEDNEMVMEMARDMLENNGYKVVSTFLPRVALDLIRSGRLTVDLLVTDVVMPQMNGPELYRHMQKLLPGLPVLYMSGYSSNAIHGIMLGEKAAFLTKPFSSAAFLERIEQILAS